MGDLGGSTSRAFLPYVYAAPQYTWVVTPIGSRRFNMPLRELAVMVLGLLVLLGFSCVWCCCRARHSPKPPKPKAE